MGAGNVLPKVKPDSSTSSGVILDKLVSNFLWMSLSVKWDKQDFCED